MGRWKKKRKEMEKQYGKVKGKERKGGEERDKGVCESVCRGGGRTKGEVAGWPVHQRSVQFAVYSLGNHHPRYITSKSRPIQRKKNWKCVEENRGLSNRLDEVPECDSCRDGAGALTKVLTSHQLDTMAAIPDTSPTPIWSVYCTVQAGGGISWTFLQL